MPFPTTVPKQALSELLALAMSPDKPSNAVVALAVYDVLGYALDKVFGNTVYPVGSLNLSQIEQILNLPQLPNLANAVSDFEALVASGQSKFGAFFALLLKYGPQVAELVLQIIAITGA